MNILAHLAHLAQFYFSLIFSAINTYNCFWFDLTNKKNQWLKTKAWWKVINAYDFFPHGDSRHYWYPKIAALNFFSAEEQNICCVVECLHNISVKHQSKLFRRPQLIQRLFALSEYRHQTLHVQHCNYFCEMICKELNKSLFVWWIVQKQFFGYC